MKKLRAFFSVIVFSSLLLFGCGKTTPESAAKGLNDSEKKSIPQEPSESEKKSMCLKMFGGGSLSAWETAQAECMLNNSQSACDCMVILSK